LATDIQPILSLDLLANIARQYWPRLAVVAGHQRVNITPQYCVDIEMAKIPVLAQYSCAARGNESHYSHGVEGEGGV